ncbi:MAG: tRNA pseudouridine(38-40) synthase TruA [Mariprofundaceae bacterium]
MSVSSHALKRRVALILEYDGHGFCGWQRQENGPSVQANLEDALEKVEGVAVKTLASGRTDTGVHAEAQVAHADVCAARAERSLRAYTHGLNRHLPEGIRVLAARFVDDDFHARFDCRERAYRYQIWSRETPPALQRWRHWWMPRTLDIEAMQQASVHLLGQHDFTTFRASGCQAGTPLRQVHTIDITRRGCVISIHIRADAYLYHMVRNVVGGLVWVGVGKYSPERFKQLLEARDRCQLAATMAPAHGLYFVDAVYPAFSSLAVLAAMQSGTTRP